MNFIAIIPATNRSKVNSFLLLSHFTHLPVAKTLAYFLQIRGNSRHSPCTVNYSNILKINSYEITAKIKLYML